MFAVYPSFMIGFRDILKIILFKQWHRIKLILRKKPNKEGLYPLVIRISKDRKSTYVYTGHYRDEKFWDDGNRKIKKSHPNSVRLNNVLTKKLSEASDTILDLQSNHNEVSSKQIKKHLAKPFGEESFNSLSKVFFYQN